MSNLIDVLERLRTSRAEAPVIRDRRAPSVCTSRSRKVPKSVSRSSRVLSSPRSMAASAETFTVRRISYGVGVEKVFPVHSAPTWFKVETVRKGKVRRAKLYYLRGRVGKAAKVKTKL